MSATLPETAVERNSAPPQAANSMGSNARPPYSITPGILSRVEQIGEAIGHAEAADVARDLRLRRINRIRTIQGSLAIEGNVLTEEQVATILDGKHVVGRLRDVQEARNAIAAYERYDQWNPAREADHWPRTRS